MRRILSEKKLIATSFFFALMMFISAIWLSIEVIHAENNTLEQEQSNLGKLDEVTNLRWKEGSMATLSWGAVDEANYYVVTIAVYDADSLLGSTTTGTSSNELDVQQEIHAIVGDAEVGHVKVSAEVVAQKNTDGNVVAESKATKSELLEYELEGWGSLPAPTDISISDDWILKFKFEGDLKDVTGFYVIPTSESPEFQEFMGNYGFHFVQYVGFTMFSEYGSYSDGYYTIDLSELLPKTINEKVSKRVENLSTDPANEDKVKGLTGVEYFKISQITVGLSSFYGNEWLANCGRDPLVGDNRDTNFRLLSPDAVTIDCDLKVINTRLVSKIVLSPSSPIIYLGNAYHLGKTIEPVSAYYETIDWGSSDTGIVTVDSSGMITGIGVGEADVTAAIGNATATVKVKVYDLSSNVDKQECLNEQNRQEIIGSAGVIIDEIANADQPELSNTDIRDEDLERLKTEIVSAVSNGNDIWINYRNI